MTLLRFLAAAINLYVIVLIVRAIFSWLPPENRENEFYRFLREVTDPALRPLQRLISPVAGMDLSVLVLIVLLSVVRRALLSV